MANSSNDNGIYLNDTETRSLPFDVSPDINRNFTCIICAHSVDLTFTILQIVFGFCTVVLNMFSLIVVIKTRGIKKTVRMSLLNLIITDFLLGLVFLYHYSVVYFVFENALECYIRYVTVSILSGATLCTVMYLSLDRLIAIKFSYQYRSIVNTKTIIGVGIACWASPFIVVVGCFPHYTTIRECNYVLMTSRLTDVVFSTINLAMIVVTLTCHITVYVAALDQIKNIIPNFLGKERRDAQIRMHVKATKSTIIIALPTLALSTPMYMMFLYMAIYPDSKNTLTTLLVQNSLYNISAFTSFLNPFIYVWKIEQLRNTIKKLIFRRGLQESVPASKQCTMGNVNVEQPRKHTGILNRSNKIHIIEMLHIKREILI